MFSRRDFLKGALAAGGIMASSRLPLHARGDHEQLSLAYSHIKAGAARPFSRCRQSHAPLVERW